jgi:hypothetical protein
MNSIVVRTYRCTFLEKEESQDEMSSLTNFLGREPNSEAFNRQVH